MYTFHVFNCIITLLINKKNVLYIGLLAYFVRHLNNVIIIAISLINMIVTFIIIILIILVIITILIIIIILWNSLPLDTTCRPNWSSFKSGSRQWLLTADTAFFEYRPLYYVQ